MRLSLIPIVSLLSLNLWASSELQPETPAYFNKPKATIIKGFSVTVKNYIKNDKPLYLNVVLNCWQRGPDLGMPGGLKYGRAYTCGETVHRFKLDKNSNTFKVPDFKFLDSKYPEDYKIDVHIVDTNGVDVAYDRIGTRTGHSDYIKPFNELLIKRDHKITMSLYSTPNFKTEEIAENMAPTVFHYRDYKGDILGVIKTPEEKFIKYDNLQVAFLDDRGIIYALNVTSNVDYDSRKEEEVVWVSGDLGANPRVRVHLRADVIFQLSEEQKMENRKKYIYEEFSPYVLTDRKTGRSLVIPNTVTRTGAAEIGFNDMRYDDLEVLAENSKI